MYIHKTEEHCLSHLIYVQHIQWMSKTGRFQEHSYAMFLELLAMDCSLFIKKGCYQHICHVLFDLTSLSTSAVTDHCPGLTRCHPHKHTAMYLLFILTALLLNDLFPM